MSVPLDFNIPLFVPGNRPERFEKAAQSGADAIIIDLEDAVPPELKIAARNSLSAVDAGIPALVRINALGTAWSQEDQAAVKGRNFAAVVVPKAEATEPFEDLCRNLGVPVIALVESARGLADARRLAAIPHVSRLAFGSIDFCADIGCDHDHDALLFARSELVLASRLAGLAAPIDGVTTSIDDEALIRSDARNARRLGFGGKLCIHPRQIRAIQAGFAPDEAEVIWACKVLTGGEGAVAVDGTMVDEPVRIRARTILKRAGENAPLLVVPRERTR